MAWFWKQGRPTLLGIAGLGWLGYTALQRWRQEDVHGEVVLITGGSRGLGLALAREFARVGCRLVLCARDAQELERARHDLAQRGAEVLAVPCDVSDREQVNHLIAQATQRFGRVDILVNNAGIERDVLGRTLSYVSRSAPDACAAQGADCEYYLHWRHGECPSPVTI
jgi:NAD(P)-dependent dehydrogenase (short-subunit alcohol dehydrogenase family)